MKFTLTTTLLSCSILSAAASAQSIGATSTGGASASTSFSNPFIWNQSNASNRKCQDPYMFLIGSSLENVEAVGTICFENASDSIGTSGLRVMGADLLDKGSMAGVQADLAMHNYASQAGTASGRLGAVSGYYAAGSVAGVSGVGYGEQLNNYGAVNLSSATGGNFVGGSDPSLPPMVFNSTLGTFHIGGVRGELRGDFSSTPAQGALAGVIGVDSSTGSATSYAGWFDGDVKVLGDVSATTFTTSSSRRWKDHIETLAKPLETLAKLRGVSYRWTASGAEQIGFVAEEVAEILPEIVSFEADGETARGVDYGRVSALLVESVKAQQALLERQGAQLNALRQELSELRQEQR